LPPKVAQWGADQELEAMLAELKALHLPDGYAAKLSRRPPPQAAELEGAANRYPTHTNITIVTKDNAKRSA
jgi:hypothetical protein